MRKFLVMAFGLATSLAVSGTLAPAQADVFTQKCKVDFDKCLRKARDYCDGPFEIVSKRKYSGGIVDDALPGPVRWYRLRARCQRDSYSDYGNDNNNDYSGNSDYADGYAGGPDRFVVDGVGYNDSLIIRAKPSPGARMLGQLNEGAVVRNLGCRPASGGRWCRISPVRASGLIGWVNGKFLREY